MANEHIYKTIVVSRTTEGIATLRLNRPDKMNALDMEMRVELLEAAKKAATDDQVRVVIITGTDRAFCGGGDVATMPLDATPFTGRKRLEKLHELLITLTTMEKPVIAAVNGHAVGAGCNLALAGDIIIADQKAKFGQVFVKLGLVPDMGGAFFLTRAIGLYRAKELAFTGDLIDAYEAQRLGIVNRVYSSEEFQQAVEQLALRFAKAPTKALGLAKGLLNKSFEQSLPSMLELEKYAQAALMQSEDFKEGVQAFLGKREPVFQGK